MSGVTQAPRGQSVRSQAVLAIPAMTALGLAGLYAVGALARTSQLREADVSVREALAVESIQSLLVRGVDIVAGPIALVALLVFTFVALQGAFLVAGQTESFGRLGRALYAIAIPVVLAVIGAVDPTGDATDAAVFGLPTAAALLVSATPIGARLSWKALALLIVVANLGVLGVREYRDPSPLPRVLLTTGKTQVSAPYIGHDKGFWYYADGWSVVAVPDRRVTRASVRPQFHEDSSESLRRVVTRD